MTPVKPQEIAKGLHKLQAFYGHRLNPAQLEQYLLQLPEWFDSEYDWEYAVNFCMQECKFFPTIGELIDAAHGTVADRALWEWDDHELLSKIGRRALESIGGIYAIKNTENPSRLKADFIHAYKAFARGAKPADFKPIGVPQLPVPQVDKPAAGVPVKPIAVIGEDVNKLLGIKHDGKRAYTQWEIFLHKYFGAVQFGSLSQQEKYRKLAQKWGRELPNIAPLSWRGNVQISSPPVFDLDISHKPC